MAGNPLADIFGAFGGLGGADSEQHREAIRLLKEIKRLSTEEWVIKQINAFLAKWKIA